MVYDFEEEMEKRVERKERDEEERGKREEKKFWPVFKVGLSVENMIDPPVYEIKAKAPKDAIEKAAEIAVRSGVKLHLIRMEDSRVRNVQTKELFDFDGNLL